MNNRIHCQRCWQFLQYHNPLCTSTCITGRDVTDLQCLCIGRIESVLWNWIRESSVVRAPDLWLKGHWFESLQEQWENFLLQGRLSLCWLLFRYPVHPVLLQEHLTDPGHSAKSAGGRLQLNTHILRMWHCMKWHGAWLYGVHRTCTEMAAIHQPCQRCKYTTSMDIQKTRYKASHSCRTTCERSESALESGE